MSEKILAEQLTSFSLFRSFGPEECRELAGIAELVTCPAGDLVLRQGESSRNLWVVLEGTCEVVKDPQRPGARKIVLAEIGAGHHFGEMSFFHAAPHSASVRAKTFARLLRIGRADFDKLINGNRASAYKLAYNTIDTLAQRLRGADEQIAQLTTTRSEQSSEWSSFRGKVFDGWNL